MSLFEIGMKLKGLKASRRKFTGNLLWDYDYDRGLPTSSDFHALVNAYRGWAYICSNRNATTVAQAQLKLYATKSSKSEKINSFPTKEVSLETKNYIYSNPAITQKASVRQSSDIVEVTSHPFLDLMTNVNGFMNRFNLMELTQLFEELTGNAFWYIIPNRLGIPQEIWVMPPQNMRIIPDRATFIKGYEYHKDGNMFRTAGGIFYKEKDVVHFKMPSPTNQYYGQGPLASITEEYNLGQEMNRYENAIFKNNGRLDGAFETEQELGDYEFERLKTEIRSSFYGVSNSGKSPLLDNGVTFKPYSYAPKDMAYDKGRDKVKEVICSAFSQTLGMYDSNATRSNAESAILLYTKNAIYPRLLRMEEKINEKIMPRYDDRLFVAYDDPTPQDKEFRLKEIRTLLETGYSTVDEQREWDKKGPLGTDSSGMAFKPVNMLPADVLAENFKNMTPDQTNDAIKDLNEIARRFEERVEQQTGEAN